MVTSEDDQRPSVSRGQQLSILASFLVVFLTIALVMTAYGR